MSLTWLFLLSYISSQLAANPASKDKLKFEEVEVVLGSMAKLPCDLVPPEDDDNVALVIWYKNDDKTPIYSLDVRERDLHKGIHWADGDLEGRAQFSSDLYQAALTLADSRGSDSGLYKCRVDFKRSPTRNSLVNVSVIVPPEDIYLETSDGSLITSRILGPLAEGTPLELTCVVAGGVPSPRVSWWYNLTILDDSYDVLQDGHVRNTISLGKTEREHLHGVLTCQALNSPFVVPKSTSVTIDLYLGPLDVRLLGDNLAMTAGSEYEVACQTSGSRPPATLTWWKSGVPLPLAAREESSIEGNVTTSTIRLRPEMVDHGAKLSCRATNPRVPNKALEASWTLDVHFRPLAEISLISENKSPIKEGMSIALVCKVHANPSASRVHWLHNDFEIQSGMDYQVFPNNTLSLVFLTRKNSGKYACAVENSQGASESPVYLLDVKYIPKCNTQETKVYGASLHEDVNVTCNTTSNPPATRYWWHYNSSSPTTAHPANGSAVKVALSDIDSDVTLTCWAENEVGNQSVPCSYRVVLAESPEAPSNCSLSGRGDSWLTVHCEADGGGGLPQILVAEVWTSGHLVANASQSGGSGGVIQFTLTGLGPGIPYSILVRSLNVKGASSAAKLQATTTGQLIPQRRITEMSFSTFSSILLLGLGSFVTCILAGVLALSALLLYKRLHQPAQDIPHELKKAEMNVGVECCTLSDDDRNPDVVPCSSELTVLEVQQGEETILEVPVQWEGQIIADHESVHFINTQNVPCIPNWGVVGWKGSCPNIAQRHVETQTPQNVLESVV